ILDMLDLVAAAAADIVDQYRRRAELGTDPLAGVPHLRRAGDVAAPGGQALVSPARRRHELFDRDVPVVDEGKSRAARRQSRRDRGTDAARRAGDDGDLALERAGAHGIFPVTPAPGQSSPTSTPCRRTQAMAGRRRAAADGAW